MDEKINLNPAIIALERIVMDCEVSYNSMNAYGLTETEILQRREKIKEITQPYKMAIQILKEHNK